MRNEKMITRTIHSTSCRALVIKDGAPIEKLLVLPGKYDEVSALKHVRKTNMRLEGSPIVYIYTAEEREELYGMPVSLFMKYAEPLDPRKASEDDE